MAINPDDVLKAIPAITVEIMQLQETEQRPIVNVAIGRVDGAYLRITKREQTAPGNRVWKQLPDGAPQHYLTFRDFEFYVGDSQDFTEAATRIVKHICLGERTSLNRHMRDIMDEATKRARTDERESLSQEVQDLKAQLQALIHAVQANNQTAPQPVYTTVPTEMKPQDAPLAPEPEVAPATKKHQGQDLNRIKRDTHPKLSEKDLVAMGDACGYFQHSTLKRMRDGRIHPACIGKIRRMYEGWLRNKPEVVPADLPAPTAATAS